MGLMCASIPFLIVSHRTEAEFLHPESSSVPPGSPGVGSPSGQVPWKSEDDPEHTVERRDLP